MSNLEFATSINIGKVGENAATLLLNYRGRVQAVGVALLFAYVINFICQAYVTFGKKQGKQIALRKLLQTSQILYWFGVACIFSILPPFYQGVFNCIMAFITLVIVLILHISCFTTRKIKERALWSLMHFFYHFSLIIWVIVALIMSYIWTNNLYTVDTA